MGESRKNNFRKDMAMRFVKALEEDPKNWKKPWDYSYKGKPFNLTTNKFYKGVNSLWLKMRENANVYNDPRWATFNQIRDKGYKLKQGSKGEKIEYCMPIDCKEGKAITWEEFEKVYPDELFNKNGLLEKRYIIRAKTFTVFNASQIEGVSEFEYEKIHNNILPDEVVEKVAYGLGVVIEEYPNSSKAYYSISEDKIHMPLHTQFKSDYGYAATALHELSHSTGHRSRLNRNIYNKFGSQNFAFEELIAEISGCFMSEYVKAPLTEEQLENHEAYIQGWARRIRRNSNYLFKAISEAEKASEYMIEKGGLEKTIDQSITCQKEEEKEALNTEAEADSIGACNILEEQNEKNISEIYEKYEGEEI